VLGQGTNNVTNALYSGILAGSNNRIEAGAINSFIGGGSNNLVGSNSFNSFIGAGFDNAINIGVIINKMDILTGFNELKICVKYKHPELGEIEDFPWDAEILAKCEPVYISLPGWSEEIPKAGMFSDLPKNAQSYLATLEKHTGTRILWVGTGPGRDDMLKTKLT
jgi:hypothetical protein